MFPILTLHFFAESLSAQSHMQKVQWASKMVNYSSQYDDEEFAAKFVVGQPNVLPLGGDKPGAWAVGYTLDDNDKKQESDDQQYIWVEYARPQKVQQIAIAESNAPGAVSKVYLYDADGNENLVFEQVPQNVTISPRIFNVMIERTTYDVVGVKVILEPNMVDGWNEIDAIGIADHKEPITWKINLAKDLKWSAKPENLGTNVNTSATELMDAIAPDGKTIYYSRHSYEGNIGGAEGNSDAYFSVLRSDGTWSPGTHVEGMINNAGNNYVNSITPDGNVLCVGNVYESDGSNAGKSGVSFSYRTPNGWGVPIEAQIDDFYVNGTTSNYFQSNDGKVLLMSLMRNDTYGDNDLYVSFLKGDGTWTPPLNLGEHVNTVMTESGPTLAADGKTLYFSSNGRSGYGAADLFLTRRLDDSWTNWSEPENLGDGINSAQSDQFYYIAAAGDYAYYTSKAVGGHGGGDVYRIMLPEAVKPKVVLMVSGRTFDANTKAPIEAVIKYEILPEGKDAGVARSSKGKGEYKIVLPTGANYGFRAEAKGYYPASDNLDLASLASYTEITKDLYLSPIEVGQVIRLNNIFFETAKSELKAESFPELDRAVTFLNDNAELRIAIGGHTDNVGNNAANDALSTARAKSVMDYLSSKGITTTRMTSRGFGETKPMSTNDTEEGRQLNRRVEFTIVN